MIIKAVWRLGGVDWCRPGIVHVDPAWDPLWLTCFRFSRRVFPINGSADVACACFLPLGWCVCSTLPSIGPLFLARSRKGERSTYRKDILTDHTSLVDGLSGFIMPQLDQQDSA